MRRPTRTRRRSIAGIVSLLMFAVIAVLGVRSFWTWDQWNVGNGIAVGVDDGCLFYTYDNQGAASIFSHQSGEPVAEFIADSTPPRWKFLGFSVVNLNWPLRPSGEFKVFIFRVPDWFPLILLLIIPVRWLIGRPASAPAFPVITKQP